MKKIILSAGLLLNLINCMPAKAETESYQVDIKDINNGYIVRKVWLTQYAMPEVLVSGVGYADIASLPAGVTTGNAEQFKVKLGMERKRPFAVVYIPAYASTGGKASQVSSFVLTINEQPAAQSAHATARTTADVTKSVLSSGTWHKIGVARTGFCKIDNAFITSMGLTPANVNPNSIRIFGNGGNILSERNDVPRAADLRENAIQVNANGDGSFDAGESVVFYAVGPTGWLKDSINQRFIHTKNIYSDTAYYFITFDQSIGSGLRVPAQTGAPTGNVTVSSFNYYDVHDEDKVNPGGIGKIWYGEQFYTQLGTNTQTFNFDMGTSVTDVYASFSLGCTSNYPSSSFSLSVNGTQVGQPTFTVATVGEQAMALAYAGLSAPVNSQSASITLRFNPSDGSSVGFLNYIELNARRSLVMTGDQMSFRDWQSVGAGKKATYQLQGANGNTQVWDVTDPQLPVSMAGSLSGSTYTFTQDAETLHEFAAMNSGNLVTPRYIGSVANQNLHGSEQVDGIIVTNPLFLEQANRLADFHRQHDKLRIVVATTTQVYNEFSSGGQDIAAIRDFARMFYKRAGNDTSQMPRYLLLFGGASYDYKNRLANNSNFVPVFESDESSYTLDAYSSDDFYGFLDDNENIEDNTQLNTLEVGIGRLPARSVDDAGAMVDKVINYSDPSTFGPWRIASTIVTDNADAAGNHMQDGEDMAATVTADTKNLYNHQKVYVDAIPTVSTPAGERCPNANAAINDNVRSKGTLFVNYNGHGNPQVWATERILTQDDYTRWNNKYMMPFMVTATCDFGQFDHPQFVSSAEQLVLRRNGGAIALLTTTQAVFASYNHKLNIEYLEAQFTRNAADEWNTFGDASRIGKNKTFSVDDNPGILANFHKFSLLGDPMVTPAFPLHKIVIDSVTDGLTGQLADTIKALGMYSISGSVHDYHDAHLLTDFNGMLSVSFFDKARVINTIKGTGATFKVQDNLVHRGRVSVNGGRFILTFIAPKDINYLFGAGKVSTYATNGITDGAGADTSVAVGGFSDHPQNNDESPVVQPYINDSMFQNGGITGTNTSLFVSLFSKTGINVTGNTVGHDLVGILDGEKDNPYILNDYYETAPNTYQRGYVTYPVSGIANGRHTFTVRAWDVNNNVGEGSVDFVVIDGKVISIQNLGNYPNPFSDKTHFVFEHNHPEEELDVNIVIYDAAGGLAKHINQTFTPSGSRTAEITWDGVGDNGQRLASGVYVYRFTLSTEKGYRATAYQKLVIVR